MVKCIFSPKKGNFPKNMDFNEFSGNSHIIKVHQIVKIFKSIAGGLGKVFEKNFFNENMLYCPKTTFEKES